MIWKITIILWVLALVARHIVKITASREDRIAATLFGKARITLRKKGSFLIWMVFWSIRNRCIFGVGRKY